MSTKLAVFDCDGTLVDGQAAVCSAMEQAFADCGLAAPPGNSVRRIVGLSLPVAMRTLAPDVDPADHTRLVDAYRQAFFEARKQGRVAEPLFEGIEPVLRALHGRGWLLGVATGKSDRGLEICLTLHGVRDLFTTLQTADRHPSKPHPAMLHAAMAEAGADVARTVMIGDTTYDIEMARTAGVRSLGVSWGYHAREELLTAGAASVAGDARELEELIDG